MHHDLRTLWLYFLHLTKLAFNPFRHLKFEHLYILNNCVFFTEMICSFIIFRSSAIIPLSWKKKNGVLESLFINVTCLYVTILSYVSLIWWIMFFYILQRTQVILFHTYLLYLNLQLRYIARLKFLYSGRNGYIFCIFFTIFIFFFSNWSFYRNKSDDIISNDLPLPESNRWFRRK